MKDGPGVFVIKKAYENTAVIDHQTAIFHQIIAEEKAKNSGKGDHFGNNERIWNAIQKTCEKDPQAFVDYYSNPLLALACLAWLGPGYQMTAQVNSVRPDSKAQMVHRDYHLGFQSVAVKSQFASHVQVMSQFLTLQGAIAHTDMPVSSGPTMFLPFSQQYEAGCLTYERLEFIAHFEQNYVQLPLEKGDMVFFNPALYRGAGANHDSKDRLANLVQISSPFGKPMEAINHCSMILSIYPTLLEKYKKHSENKQIIDNSIAAVADGYSFPTNLDSDPPIGGNAQQTEQQLMKYALEHQWSVTEFEQELHQMIQRRKA